MNPFDLLPDEKIYEICKTLDDKSLTQLTQTYSRVHDVCYDIVLLRKNIKERNKEIIKYISTILSFVHDIHYQPERNIQIKKIIELYDYVSKNRELLEDVSKRVDGNIVSTLIKKWLQFRYKDLIPELEQFRPFITEINTTFNINTDLTK